MSVNESFGVGAQTGALELGGSGRLARTDARTRAGIVGLCGVAALSTFIAIAAAGTNVLMPETLRPVPTALGGPFVQAQHLPGGIVKDHGLFGLTPGNWVVMAALLALFGCYVVAVRCADRLSPRAVIGTAIGCTLVMLLAPPIISTDVFSYQAYGRMFTIYGANPYLNGPYSISLDPVFHNIGAKWISTPSVYGPLFTLLSGALAGPLRISQSGIGVLAYSYKTIGAASCLGTMWLLWRGCKLRGLNGTRAIALFGLNPLVTLYAVGGGHNDLLTVLLSTGAVYVLLGHRERTSGALISAATMIKLTAGLVFPFALVSGVGLGAAKRRRGLLLGAGAAMAAILIAGFAVFGGGLLHLPATLDQVQNEGAGQTLPGFISGVLRIGWLGHLVGILQGLIFLAVCVWLLRKVNRGEMDWIDGAAWATFGILVSTSSILPWYVTWLLPLVGLCTTRRLWTVALWFTGWVLLTTMLAYIPHGATILGIG